MRTQEFTVLYTHHKLKKAKVWQDGILKISHLGNKATLYDDKGQCLESIFLKCLEVKPGDELEGDRYLITVEEVTDAGPAAVGPTITKATSGLGRCVPSGRAQGCQPAGLKRKFTGFHGPRQVPPKIAVTDSSELAASLETKKAVPVFLSPLYDTSPLFSAAGRKDINNRPAGTENTVAYENRERNGVSPFSLSAGSKPALKIHPGTQGDEHFCPPGSPESKRSRSFLTEEPMKRDGLSPHHSGLPHSIRSTARILALLKSKSTIEGRDLDSELREHCPQGQLHDCVTSPPQPGCSAEQEKSAEGKQPEELQSQQPWGNSARKTSRWAIYLPSQRSPEHSSTEEESDPAGKPTAQEGCLNLNQKDILAQNRKQFFETHAEGWGGRKEDKPVANHDPSWGQVESAVPSFRESSGVPASRSQVENGGSLSESGIQENSKIPVRESNPPCPRESLLIRENAEESCVHREAEESEEPESDHLQMEASLRNSAWVSGDITHVFSKGDSVDENLNHIPEFRDNVEQPLVEVNFNLNNFEASDTEEESQESHKMSQESEGWVEEASVTDDLSGPQRQHEGESCKEAGGAQLPLLASHRVGPIEPLSQFCDKTRVGFWPGPWGAGNTGRGIEQYSDTVCNLDSSFEWPDDDNIDNNEEANPLKASINNNFASLPNTCKKTETNLHTSPFPNLATDQPPKHNLFSGQSQPSVWGDSSDVNKEQVCSPPTSSSDAHAQLLKAKQNLAEEHMTLGESHTEVPSPLFHSVGTRRPTAKDLKVHIAEPQDAERIQQLPLNLTGVETAGGKQYSDGPQNSSEPSGFLNNISLLKSLSEHSTALEGLEIMKRKNSTRKPQHRLRPPEPECSGEAGGSLTVVASQAVPESPHLAQDSRQMQKENEVEAAEPLQSLEFFPLESEEEPTFVAVTPRQVETAACDPQPVEFQGHRVKGSAAGAVMVRGPSTPQGHGPFPRGPWSETNTAHASLLTPWVPSIGVQADFLQFPNEEYFAKGGTSCTTEDSYQAITESEKDSFKNDFTKKSSFLENKTITGLPLVSSTQALLTTSPPHFAPGCRPRGWHEDPALPASDFGPEHPGEMCFPQAPGATTPRAAPRLGKGAAPSKWLKYRNTTQAGPASPGRVEKGAVYTPPVGGTGPGQRDVLHDGSADAERLQRVQDMLRPQQQACSSQGLVSRSKAFPEVNGSELHFPSVQETKSASLPQRHIHIPAVFQSPAQYKQIFTSCLIEHLNIMLFGLAQRLHRALARVDISFYTSPKGEEPEGPGKSVPSCYHQHPAKLVMVKKDGPNKGRLFYACDGPKTDQCKFFKWFEAVPPGHFMPGQSPPVRVLSDIKSIGLYLRSQKLPLYEECHLILRKGFDFQRKQYGKLKKFAPVNSEFYSEPKSKLYLKLSRKESSSTYSKDDLWVVSKTLDFELDTFIACSAFFGPSSASEVELLPLKGYFPSKWLTNTVVHALLVCNASTELTTLKNIQDHFNPATLPLTQFLLTMSSTAVSNKAVSKRRFTPPAFSALRPQPALLGLGPALQLADELIGAHQLNQDQAAALTQIARMMVPPPGPDELAPQAPPHPITIIHGVFGAGKSYLLALVVLFFVQLFEKSEAAPLGSARPWKVLISSSTNVAVDRVLLGLLSLGFEKFVRVGSIRKIAKPILPYSLHAGSENESEQLKELQALMREDLSPVERVYVRRSIEQHKLGTNRTLLRQVRVVGVTCAACPFPCMNDLKFPVVVLDECSQITEPASLLPIARFECEKLILVGDPKQLPPTIQGSEAAHDKGLEQTLFDRLCLMGHEPILLRTQYRCHPAISAIVNDLFYEGRLQDGVCSAERGPLLAWLPTLCFYHVRGLEQMDRDNSFHNVAEAAFTLKLIQSLLASGVAGSTVGVITLYRSQMHKLCQALAASPLEQPNLRAVQVSTVDAFQGAEKEVIILSCVRTRHVGFIDSERRMNVALTRGRRHLLIVGNLACLRENRLWGQVIQHCEGREGGLQHASQIEPQLDRLLKDYVEEQAAAKQKKKRERERLTGDACSQEAVD